MHVVKADMRAASVTEGKRGQTETENTLLW